MGLSLALIALGFLTLMDRMGKGYGLKEGWPWIIVALGIGRLYRNGRSVPGWITTIVGILIVGAKYYSLQLSLPSAVRTYFLPILLILIGLLWIWRYRKD